MKRLLVAFLSFSLLAGQVSADTAPDILIDTKLDADWSGILVSRLRRLMKNMKQPDPFRQKFSEPITVSEGLVKDFLSPDATELLTDLGSMLDMDILNGQTQVTMHGFRYEVNGFKTEIEETEQLPTGIAIGAHFAASKVNVRADKVTLSLLIPGKKSLPVINIDILNPIISGMNRNLVNFDAKLQILDEGDLFRLFLEKADFSSLATNLVHDGKSIQLQMKGVVVPEVSIKIGNKEIKFDPKKIENLILSKKKGIKDLLVAQVSSLLTGGLANEKLQVINDVDFKKEYWIDSTTMQSMLRMATFKGKTNGRSLQLKLDGDFCTTENFVAENENCLNTRKTQPAKSRFDEGDHAQSQAEVNGMLNDGDANIVVSISEDYINKALATAFDAGMLNEQLKNAGVELGPNKLFVRMDERGANTGTLYMDVLFTPSKIQRMALGEKEVRFPLAIQVGLRITQEKGIPKFTIFSENIDTSDEMLINGKPEFGVISNIKDLRFKKKVLNMIRTEVTVLENKDMMSLNFPALRGLGLDKVNFVSDGNGRMNALILLKDTTEEGNEFIK